MKGGVIGLGGIGRGVAQCLARAGKLAGVYDIDPAIAPGMDVAFDNSPSPRAVSEICDVVLIAVFNSTQARDVLLGKDGVLAAQSHAPIVLLSTVAIADFEMLRDLAEGAQREFLDCGVTGGSSVESGGLVCLLGGRESTVAKVLPVLEAFSRKVFHMGGPGSGMAAKIARNVIIYGTWLAEYEAFRLAGAAGVDRAILVRAIEESQNSIGGPCPWPRGDPAYGTDMIDLTRRLRAAGLLAKDLQAAVDLGELHGLTLPGVLATLAHGPAIAGIEPAKS